MKIIKTDSKLLNSDAENYDRYIKEISSYKPLSKKREIELFKRIDTGPDPDAVAEICRHNLLFVVAVARHFARNLSSTCLTLEDLINEGNLGLMRAIGKYDYRRKHKFISYAVWWIRRAIQDLIDYQTNAVNLGYSENYDLLRKILKKKAELSQGREITNLELYSAMKESLKEMGFDRFDKIANLTQQKIKLDSLSSSVSQMQEEEDVHEILVQKEIAGLSAELCLVGLTDREVYVLECFFGLNGHEETNMAKIGKKLGISRERVRQIKDAALAKLLSSNQIKKYQELAGIV